MLGQRKAKTRRHRAALHRGCGSAPCTHSTQQRASSWAPACHLQSLMPGGAGNHIVRGPKQRPTGDDPEHMLRQNVLSAWRCWWCFTRCLRVPQHGPRIAQGYFQLEAKNVGGKPPCEYAISLVPKGTWERNRQLGLSVPKLPQPPTPGTCPKAIQKWLRPCSCHRRRKGLGPSSPIA